MSLPTLMCIGSLLKKQSARHSSLLIRHVLKQSVQFDVEEALFFEMHHDMVVPFFVVSSESINNTTSIVCVGNSEELFNPRTIKNKSIYIPDQAVTRYAHPRAPIMLSNYMVYHHDKFVGKIKNWIYQDTHTTLMVVVGEKEWTLPYHEDFIENLNSTKKTVTMSWPDNLFSILENG